MEPKAQKFVNKKSPIATKGIHEQAYHFIKKFSAPLRLFAWIFVAMMSFYGWLAIDAGTRLIAESTMDREALVEERQSILENASLGLVVDASEQPLWTRMVGQLTTQSHIFGRDSYYETHVYLAQMPSVNAIVLGLHAALAGICMLLGGLQFLPAFRKKWPHWHGKIGKIFFTLGQISMCLSIIYLLRTGPENTFAGLTFHVGLWFLSIAVSISLLMGVYHIKRKEVRQHQVYMGLAYGLMLTAPLLRYDWMSLGVFFHENLSFNEINYAVVVMLIPQSFLIGYLLILFNRWNQKSVFQEHVFRQRSEGIRVKEFVPLFLIMSIFCLFVWTILHYNIVGQSLFGNPAIKPTLSEQLWPHLAETKNMMGNSTFVFSIVLCLSMLSLFLIKSMELLNQFKSVSSTYLDKLLILKYSMTSSIILIGGIQLYWSTLLGLPSHETLSGGTGMVISGIACLSFGFLMIWALKVRDSAYFKEWAVFGLLFSSSPLTFIWSLELLALLRLDPEFIQGGHGYLLASAAGPTMGIIGFLFLVKQEKLYARGPIKLYAQ